MNRKIINNQDVQLVLLDNVFNTSGCNNSNELYNKYKDTLEEIGIPSYVINRVKNDSGDYFIFNVDNIGSITTLGCTDVSTFISINQEKLNLLAPELKENIISNFTNILSMSNENKSEITANENVDYENEIASLEKQKADIITKKRVLNTYKLGLKDLKKETADSKTRTLDNISFEQRREKINQKIKDLLSGQSKNLDVKEAKKKLTQLGFTFPDSYSNFIFATHKEKSAKYIFEELKKRDIYVRYFNAERIDNYLRISIGTDEEMNQVFKVLEEILV